MKCNKKYMALYAVTDRSWLGEQSLTQQVEQALSGGITCLQLREKALSTADFTAEALEIKALCKKYKVPFLINDNVAVALACGADGVHVGQQDMAVTQARASIGNEMMLGVSVQTVAQALQAEAEGADYLGVGAVFATSTKLDADHPTLETVQAICEAVSIPVVAIGGIGAENIDQLSGLGLDGVAVVSAIFGAKDIIEATRELRRRSDKLCIARRNEV